MSTPVVSGTPTATVAADVVVIGAGVVGSAIARELSRYRLSVVLVEAGPDVGAGTSKANTAILHTGFDAKPGSLEARLVRRGAGLLHAWGTDAGIAIERVGALLVAWTAEELEELLPIAERAMANGYTATRPVPVEELYRREPHLGPGALGALEVPDESIVCPFTTPIALATQALRNGARLLLRSLVVSARIAEDGWHELGLVDGSTLRARWVVDAAGLGSDTIDRLFGGDRFTITPRRGELIVFDKLARSLVDHILLPVPTKAGKGVLVAPTVYGNVVLGPTAEDIADRTDTASTAHGLAILRDKGRRILPGLLDEEVTAVYVGLRAATEHSDYQLWVDADRRYACAGGIRSTGLTACMAIAEYLVEGMREAGLGLQPRDDFEPVRMPPLGEAQIRPWRDPAAVAADPDGAAIVCHCERVTYAEIRAAATADIPARSLDGLRRRTRALMGRCGGFGCSAPVTALLAKASGVPATELLAMTPERLS